MFLINTAGGDTLTISPEVADLAYLEPYYIPNAYPSCSCVDFVQSLGSNITGNAYQIQPNIDRPIAGGSVLLKEGSYGHVAYILKVEKDSIIIIESNFVSCKITYRRISLDSKIIRGYTK